MVVLVVGGAVLVVVVVVVVGCVYVFSCEEILKKIRTKNKNINNHQTVQRLISRHTHANYDDESSTRGRVGARDGGCGRDGRRGNSNNTKKISLKVFT